MKLMLQLTAMKVSGDSLLFHAETQMTKNTHKASLKFYLYLSQVTLKILLKKLKVIFSPRCPADYNPVKHGNLIIFFGGFGLSVQEGASFEMLLKMLLKESTLYTSLHVFISVDAAEQPKGKYFPVFSFLKRS